MKSILVIIFCFFCSVLQAQTLPKEEVDAAVVKISDLIKSNYVFEEQGNKIAAHFEQKKLEFKSVKNWDEFATTCNEILQAYSKDGHLFVRHDAKVVKELLTATEHENDSAVDDPFFHSKEASERNFGFEEVRILKDNIGFIKLSEINVSEKSLPTLFAAMEFVSNTKALILDLRDNGGGGSEVGSVLESMFLPKNIDLLEFKSRTGEVTTEKTVPWLTQKKYSNPLFIIINKKTASAAEALAFALQANKRAIVVGSPSAGAAYMNSWYVVNEDIFVSISTGAPTLPGTDKSWEKNGIQPDNTVAEGDELKYILEKIKKD